MIDSNYSEIKKRVRTGTLSRLQEGRLTAALFSFDKHRYLVFYGVLCSGFRTLS